MMSGTAVNHGSAVDFEKYVVIFDGESKLRYFSTCRDGFLLVIVMGDRHEKKKQDLRLMMLVNAWAMPCLCGEWGRTMDSMSVLRQSLHSSTPPLFSVWHATGPEDKKREDQRTRQTKDENTEHP